MTAIYTNYPSDVHKPRLLPADAVQQAYQHIGSAGDEVGDWDGRCASFVVHCYGHNGVNRGTAWKWWNAIPSNWKSSDSPPPVGAMLFWNSNVGGGAGHAAIMVEDGKAISTSGPNFNGKPGICGYETLLKYMGRGYVGWAAPWIVNDPRPVSNGWNSAGLMQDKYGGSSVAKVTLSGITYSVKPAGDGSGSTDGAGADDTGSADDAAQEGGVELSSDDYVNVKRTSEAGIKFNPPPPNIHRRVGFYGGNGAWVDLDYKDISTPIPYKPGVSVPVPYKLGTVSGELIEGYEWSYPAPTSVSKGSLKAGDRWHTGTIVRDYSFTETAGDRLESGFAGPEGDTKYGFKFLFNPGEYKEDWRAPLDGSPMTMAKSASLGSTFFSTSSAMSIQLFLSRVDDIPLLSEKEWERNYPAGSITKQDRDMLLNTGTLWDLEYLFRLCNGKPWNTWRGHTAEIGLLLAMMVQIQMGPRLIRGIIDSISVSHQMFTVGMVPTVTQVSLNIARVIDAGTASDVDATGSTDSAPATTDSHPLANEPGHDPRPQAQDITPGDGNWVPAGK